MSQLGLALEAEISTRHLSFLETGRAQPSRDMVLLLSQVLDVPPRSRNDLLTAAGYAPIYRETALDAPEMAQVRRALGFMLRQPRNALRHHAPRAPDRVLLRRRRGDRRGAAEPRRHLLTRGGWSVVPLVAAVADAQDERDHARATATTTPRMPRTSQSGANRSSAQRRARARSLTPLNDAQAPPRASRTATAT